MTLYKWSQVASSDATADSTINWSEGQAPSSINDSARAMMAATAKYRDDIAGAIVTTGTATAYLISSYQAFDTLAHLGGQMIAFTPHVTNSGTCTINLDSLGAKPLRTSPNMELAGGTIIQGTPYVAVYNNSDGVFYLQGFMGNPYNIPIAGSLHYWGATAPNSSFAFPYGQAISRTTYSALFGVVGTTFGSGDGSTTFNLPDLRGRVAACPDNMGGTDASRLTGSSITSLRTTLGGTGGEGTHSLATSEIPTLTSIQNGINISVGPSGGGNIPVTPGTVIPVSGGGNPTIAAGTNSSWSGVGTLSGTINVSATSQGTTSGSPTHNNVQPTILCNSIMRII